MSRGGLIIVCLLYLLFHLLDYNEFISTETWLSLDIDNAKLSLTGFPLFSVNRNALTSTCTCGGHVLIAVKQTLLPSLLNSFEVPNSRILVYPVNWAW